MAFLDLPLVPDEFLLHVFVDVSVLLRFARVLLHTAHRMLSDFLACEGYLAAASEWVVFGCRRGDRVQGKVSLLTLVTDESTFGFW